MSCRAVPCRVALRCGMLCCVLLSSVDSCCVVLCIAVLFCFVRCRVVSFRVVLCCIFCFVLLILFDCVFIVQLESRKIEISHTTILLSKQRLLPESHNGRFRGEADRTNLLPFFSHFRNLLQEEIDTEHRYLLHVPRPNPLQIHPRPFINCGFGLPLSLSEFPDPPPN